MGIGGFLAVVIAASWTFALCGFDIAQRRLPDALTVPPAVAGVVATLLALPLGCPSLAWALLWPAGYLVAGQGIGGGDIKLAVSLGVVCAAFGGALAVLLAIGVSGLFTVVFAGLLGRRTVPHGPSMLVAAWLTGIYFGV